MSSVRTLLAAVVLSHGLGSSVLAGALDLQAKNLNTQVLPRVLEWRRDLHQNPELSNREFRTSKLVAAHLKSLGLKVETGIAHTGVVALLEGGKPGPTIALRADMDGLPVTEEVDLPFRSKVTTTYNGATVGVMHACGHDVHTAILMGAAQTLTRMRADLPGKVLFIFQPAEEGPPAGEDGGAQLMLKEGVFERYKPQAAFGLHVMSVLNAGELGYRVSSLMAASNGFRISVQGKQSHGSRPWQGIDPVVAAAQIVSSLQTVVSRDTDLTEFPAVVTVGMIHGGVRNNIIPDVVEMAGTIRTFDDQQRAKIMRSVERVVTHVSQAHGATATFALEPNGNPVLSNDEALTERMRPVLEGVVGKQNVKRIALITGAEDFAWFAQAVPSFYFIVGTVPAGEKPAAAPANHSPRFFVDESAVSIGLEAMTRVALASLGAPP